MLDDFNLHAIVRLGEGVFAPYTDIPCNLLFFEAGGPTNDIWYYEILPPEDRKKYSKTKPIQPEEFAEATQWWNNRTENENAWKLNRTEVETFDEEGKLLNVNLDQKNPNRKSEFEYKDPKILFDSIMKKEEDVFNLMKAIQNEI